MAAEKIYATQDFGGGPAKIINLPDPVNPQEGATKNYVDAKRFSQTFGDGAATTFVITHGLGTQDVEVAVYRVAAPNDQIYPNVQMTDVNNVTLIFQGAPTINQYRVVVKA